MTLKKPNAKSLWKQMHRVADLRDLAREQERAAMMTLREILGFDLELNADIGLSGDIIALTDFMSHGEDTRWDGDFEKFKIWLEKLKRAGER